MCVCVCVCVHVHSNQREKAWINTRTHEQEQCRRHKYIACPVYTLGYTFKILKKQAFSGYQLHHCQTQTSLGKVHTCERMLRSLSGSGSDAYGTEKLA